MSLAEKLSTLNQANRNKIPADALAVMDRATTSLQEESLVRNVLKEGNPFPNATLKDPYHNEISLEEEIKGKKTIISFYRGGWCPYCNLELRALQQELENFEALGAQLVAISPETPDNSLSSKEKHELKFKVLSDANNTLAEKLGLVFRLPEALIGVYNAFGIDLEKSQGNTDWNLPLPATFILDENGIVKYVYANEDYTKRAEPENIKNALKNLG